MRDHFNPILTRLGLALLLAACGDGGSSSPGENTGASETLGSQSAESALALCQWANEEAAKMTMSDEQACSAYVIFAETPTSQQECESGVQSCLLSLGQQSLGDAIPLDCQGMEQARQGVECGKIPRASYEACIRKLVEIGNAQIAELQCANLEGLQDFGTQIELPPGCDELLSGCSAMIPPDLILGDASDLSVPEPNSADDAGAGSDAQQGGELRCSETETAPWDWVCDGVIDCQNGLDEANCP